MNPLFVHAVNVGSALFGSILPGIIRTRDPKTIAKEHLPYGLFTGFVAGEYIAHRAGEAELRQAIRGLCEIEHFKITGQSHPTPQLAIDNIIRRASQGVYKVNPAFTLGVFTTSAALSFFANRSHFP